MWHGSVNAVKRRADRAKPVHRSAQWQRALVVAACLGAGLVGCSSSSSTATTSTARAGTTTTTAIPTTTALFGNRTPTESSLPTASPGSTSTAEPTTVPETTTTIAPKYPLIIEYGFDLTGTATTARNASKVDALPFDGITIRARQDPCSTKPVTDSVAKADMLAMPKLRRVKHNFLMCRFEDSANADGLSPYDIANDASWATISANLKIYAAAAKASGQFDGIMIDSESYGIGPNPWNYDTIPIPFKLTQERPWTLPDDARELAQRRGKQLADAMREGWPGIIIFSLRGAELSDPATYDPSHQGGDQWAWINELAGPFFIGMVESVHGTAATIITGGESYQQRTQEDFTNAYEWLKRGLANSGGPIIPSGAVTAETYTSTVQVANQIFDRDARAAYADFSAAEVQTLLTYARKASDQYVWFYNEQFDWRNSGDPKTPVPQEFLDAVAAARAA